MNTKPKIGLFVTALLEDDYNKTGHMRPKMSDATDRIANILSQYGEIINPGFIEYEPDADKATQVFNSSEVDQPGRRRWKVVARGIRQWI